MIARKVWIPVVNLSAVLFFLRTKLCLVLVRGSSMEPTLNDGDRLLVIRRCKRGSYGVGDVVVFRSPPVRLGGVPLEEVPWLVKRVAAVGGGEVTADTPALRGDREKHAVPQGFLEVRGDNPTSRDSRHFGLIPTESVLGPVARRGRRLCVLRHATPPRTASAASLSQHEDLA